MIAFYSFNWFFNQWYYNHGHPKLDITYDYNSSGPSVTVNIKQTQHGIIFNLPFAIDIYEGKDKKRYHVWMNDSVTAYTFSTTAKPELINAV